MSSDVRSAGSLPSPMQMMQVSQDEELRQYSMQWVASLVWVLSPEASWPAETPALRRIARILQESGINLSEDTLKHLWSTLAAKQGGS